MADQPRISDAEWRVMEVLWAQSPRSAAEVVEALSAAARWSPRTVKTMLNRLVKKGAVKFEQDQNRYLYRPAVSRALAVRTQSRWFLRRFFGGDVGPLLAHFVEHEKLSAREIAELRELLARKG